MGERTIIIISLIIFNVVFLIFIAGIVGFIRQYRLKKKSHLSEIQGIDETHKKELLETEIEIQTETMKHIGREIHDNIGQKLTLASLYTQQLAFENKAPQINSSIINIGTIINESLTELRQLSKSLTDNTIEQTSLNVLIENECKRVRDLKHCEVEFNNQLKTKVHGYSVKSILLRITQEFLQNSIKHANCKKIEVSLMRNDSHMTLQLQDDGHGFDLQSPSTGIGLKNIDKRTQLIGGTTTMKSDSSGTILTIQIPL